MDGQGRPPTGIAHAALSKLFVGAIRNARDLHEQNTRGPNALKEGWQQFQLPISGQAGSVIQWTRVNVKFAYEFHDATSQRDVPFNYPTMVQGYELETTNPVIVCACVVGWDRTPNHAVIGATVAIGAYDPTTSGLTPFKGYLHLMFEGWGAVSEADHEGIG